MAYLTLKWGEGNSKIKAKGVFTFSLPAGWSCPFAYRCFAKTDPNTGHVQDGPHTSFRCFAASDEQIRPTVRHARWHNLTVLRSLSSRKEMTACILASLPPARRVRVHVSGDFFSQKYFDAWLDVAKAMPGISFYAYTKSLRYWAARIDQVGDGHRPGEVSNFVLTASRGGRDDRLIDNSAYVRQVLS